MSTNIWRKLGLNFAATFYSDSGLKMENSSEEIIENDDINTTFYIDITLKFRLLRTTYLWKYFFSNGILSMYHTCGQDLPFTYFDVSLQKKKQISFSQN